MDFAARRSRRPETGTLPTEDSRSKVESRVWLTEKQRADKGEFGSGFCEHVALRFSDSGLVGTIDSHNDTKTPRSDGSLDLRDDLNVREQFEARVTGRFRSAKQKLPLRVALTKFPEVKTERRPGA